MIVRTYNKQDIDYINKLGIELHNNYKFNLDSFSNCLVCVNKDKILGFVTYSIIYERAEIVDIIINESYRRTGCGLALINSIISECLMKNVNNITLEVNEENSGAIKFYEKLGFNKVAIRRNYYDNGNKNAYVMEKKLR